MINVLFVGSDQIVTIPDSGEIVCEHCGAVISDKIEEKGPGMA